MMTEFDPAAFRRNLLLVLDNYASLFGIDAGVHDLLRAQIADGDDLHERSTLPGHVTISAIVLDEAGQRTLLVAHRSLKRWLQPGGHYELPEDLAASALREAAEETGLADLVLDPWHIRSGVPIDIDSHRIPARPDRNEPEHVHHDFRYLVRANAVARVRPDLFEVEGATWHDLAALNAIAPQVLRNLARRGDPAP